MKKLIFMSVIALFICSGCSLFIPKRPNQDNISSLDDTKGKKLVTNIGIDKKEYDDLIESYNANRREKPTSLGNFIIIKKHLDSISGYEKTTPGKGANSPELKPKTYAYGDHLNAIKDYINYGIELSDIYCNELFFGKSEHEKDVKTWQDNVRVFGDLLLAGIGIHNTTDPKAVAGYGLFFSGADQFLETYKENNLFTDGTLEVIAIGIQDLRKEKAKELKDKLPTYSRISDVHVQLRKYHNICSVDGIRRYVNESIQTTHQKRSTGYVQGSMFNAITEQPSRLEAQKISAQIRKQLYKDTDSQLSLQKDTTIMLYTELFYPNSDLSKIYEEDIRIKTIQSLIEDVEQIEVVRENLIKLNDFINLNKSFITADKVARDILSTKQKLDMEKDQSTKETLNNTIVQLKDKLNAIHTGDVL